MRNKGNDKIKNNKKLEKAKISKPLYHFYALLFMMFAKIRYGMKIDKTAIKGKKGPFLVLGNHTAWLDFLYFAGCIYPRPLNVVVASNLYYRKFLGSIMSGYGAIPKKQFTTDYTCIKLIKKFLDNGISVILFPEGRITVDGTTGYISPTIGKLIKWLGYPVVRGITEGSYVTRPKWGNKRTGYVKLTVDEILTTEQIRQMSASEIADHVIEKFQYNDNKSFIDRRRKLLGCHMAEGLEKLLYKCPRCGAEFKHFTKYREMKCAECGNTVIYGNDTVVKPKSNDDKYFPMINEWYSFQRECVKQEIQDENFIMQEKCKLYLSNDSLRAFAPAGEGIISLNKEGIKYEGTINGDNKVLFYKLSNHPTIAYKIGQNVEIAEGEDIFKFIFEHGLYTTKFVLAVEELFKKYNSKEV